MKKIILLTLIGGLLFACECATPRTWYFYFKGNLDNCINIIKKSIKSKPIFEQKNYEFKDGSIIFKINKSKVIGVCSEDKHFAYIIVSSCNIEDENKILKDIEDSIKEQIK